MSSAAPAARVAAPAARVAALLVARGQTVAVAETSAGGLVSARLLALPGASAYFLGGGVLYTGAARMGLLGITPGEMSGMRPSTEAYALLLAERVRQRLGADWGLAETGAAGPSGNRYGDPAGHACFAACGPGSRHARTLRTGGADREANMEAFAEGALLLLEEELRR
ncbi:CinA family protein [Roseomonas sp. SSH11]|uniref:CinA family protein n=1 Tax=Pararoseomonas baculiformis TaxID=2820812 RepID=A0ABS4ACU0_9PROT|nr:CinA family protein [Pararoseomonas baculiformis]MBP0444832.1 CinA family protein [Pararoseomonas baculiformis]